MYRRSRRRSRARSKLDQAARTRSLQKRKNDPEADGRPAHVAARRHCHLEGVAAMMSYDALFPLPPQSDFAAWAFPSVIDIDGPTWRETDDAYHIERGVPGFRKKDIAIEVRGHVLEVRGERERGLLDRERRAFRHVLALPDGADAFDVTADLRSDVLRIRIGKVPSARRRRIAVRSQSEPMAASTPDPTSTALARPSRRPATVFERLAKWARTLGPRARAWVKGV
ncbi:Hsp20/alpha crystallin family protein [Pendulispora albinea]|uniref:Hsp20/alpha crystallin family protein n=1 Tax=Pendulispora albinea TaxID=2741071 RepID=UPI00374E01CA